MSFVRGTSSKYVYMHIIYFLLRYFLSISFILKFPYVYDENNRPFGRLWWDEIVSTVVTRAEPHNQVIIGVVYIIFCKTIATYVIVPLRNLFKNVAFENYYLLSILDDHFNIFHLNLANNVHC